MPEDCYFEPIKFVQPDSVLISGTKETDQRILTALEKVLESGRSNRDTERVLKALEWFYFAHFDSIDIPDTVVIVMMATAFESLLDISGTADFAKEVEKFVAHKARRFLDNSAIRLMSRTDWQKRQRNYTKAGWWAHDCYGVRSDIVHARSWNLLYDGKSQLEIADLVFVECLKRKLEEKWSYTYTPEDEEFRKEIFKAVGF